MSQLSPEVRVNKNGIPVKKYVRVDAGDGSQQTALPEPAKVTTQGERDRARLKEAMEYALDRGDYSETNILSVPVLAKRMKHGISDATAAAYVEAVEARQGIGCVDLLMGTLMNNDPDSLAAYVLVITKLERVEDMEWSNEYKGPYCYYNALEVHTGLHDYEHLGFVPAEDILDENDPAWAQTMALIKFTQKMAPEIDQNPIGIVEVPGGRDMKFTIPDDELVKLLLERPQDADMIADLVLEELIDNGDVIRAMLEAPVQSLRDGAL